MLRHFAIGAALAAALTSPGFAAQPGSARLKEGSELRIRFEEQISSATAHSGDRFTIALADDVSLPGGLILKEGYRGVGEVTSATKRGFMGKAGELNVRLDTLRIGDQRVRLRASQGQEGKGALGATVALTVLFGPLGLLKRGQDIEVRKGQEVTAFVDGDVELTLPLATPPQAD